MILLEAVQTPTAIQIPTLLLSAIVWIPAIGAAALLLFPVKTEGQRDRLRSFTLAVVAIVGFFGVVMWFGFRDQTGTFAFEETRDWLPTLGSSYHLGVDGVSMPLLLLSSLLFVFAALMSSRVRDQVKEYFVLLLLLETGVNGVLASLDYLLFFMFWLLQAVPLFLLVARSAGARRVAAAWKLLAVELASSGLLLIAILVTYFKAPTRTFDIATLHDVSFPASIGLLVMWLFFIAFALRLPVVPFHTWFVDGQAQAPAPVALVLAGIVVKLAGYGIIRVDVGQFQAEFHKIVGAVVVIAVITMLWAAILALVQDDLRRLVAYVVVSHMGLVLLAAASATLVALNGAVLMMVADGLAAGLLVLVAAAIIDRVNTPSIAAMGGMAARMTRGALIGVLAALAAIGFPGLAGFVGQFMIVVGAYPSHRLATPLALLGLLLVAVAVILAVQRIFFGALPETYARVRDLGTLELAGTVGLFAFIALLGLLPALLVDNVTFSVISLLTRGGG